MKLHENNHIHLFGQATQIFESTFRFHSRLLWIPYAKPGFYVPALYIFVSKVHLDQFYGMRQNFQM